MPVTERWAYLNTGSVGPLPTVASDAITDALRRELTEGRVCRSAAEAGDSITSMARARFSDVVGASSEAIALTHSTGEGMNIALWSLEWKAGDEVLTTNIEHSAASIPLAVLARRRLSSVTGLRILTPASRQAGLLSFQVDGLDPSELVLRLAETGFILRWILNPYCIRVSCGFYNTESEIDNLVHTIGNLRR